MKKSLLNVTVETTVVTNHEGVTKFVKIQFQRKRLRKKKKMRPRYLLPVLTMTSVLSLS